MLQLYGIEWTSGSPDRSTSLDVHSSPLADSNPDIIQQDPSEQAESFSNQNTAVEDPNSEQPEISFVEISESSRADSNPKTNSAELKVGPDKQDKQTRFSVDSCEEIFRNLDISKIDNDETIV